MAQTLILRLTAPLQSWGVQSRFSIRDTLQEPTKSAIIGLVGSALGMKRHQTKLIEKLNELEFGVRVDKEGIMATDYHTVLDVVKAKTDVAKAEQKRIEQKPLAESDLRNVVSYRHYLQDAWFTVGLSSENEAWLLEIKKAMENPRWSPFLGRKAFVPGLPLIPHENPIQDGNLETVLPTYTDPYWKYMQSTIKEKPWWHQNTYATPSPKRLLLPKEINLENWVLVAQPMRPDTALDFRKNKRRFTNRTHFVYVPKQPKEA